MVSDAAEVTLTGCKTYSCVFCIVYFNGFTLF